MTGLGPLEPLLKDPTINDILINAHDNVYVERFGVLETVPMSFKDEAHLRIVNRIVSAVGRRVDESQLLATRASPTARATSRCAWWWTARRLDPQVLQAAYRSTASSRWAACARRPPRCSAPRSAAGCRCSSPAAPAAARRRCSTRSPSTSRTRSASSRSRTRPNCSCSSRTSGAWTRPPSIEGKGEIRQRELVKNALRMRPDRIIVGEVRRGS